MSAKKHDSCISLLMKTKKTTYRHTNKSNSQMRASYSSYAVEKTSDIFISLVQFSLGFFFILKMFTM